MELLVLYDGVNSDIWYDMAIINEYLITVIFKIVDHGHNYLLFTQIQWEVNSYLFLTNAYIRYVNHRILIRGSSMGYGLIYIINDKSYYICTNFIT